MGPDWTLKAGPDCALIDTARCRYIGIVGTQLAHEQSDFHVLPEIVTGLVEQIVRQSGG